MIAYVHTIKNDGANKRNFEIIRRFIRTLLSKLKSEPNRLNLVHTKTSLMSTNLALYFSRSKFKCLQ